MDENRLNNKKKHANEVCVCVCLVRGQGTNGLKKYHITVFNFFLPGVMGIIKLVTDVTFKSFVKDEEFRTSVRESEA